MKNFILAMKLLGILHKQQSDGDIWFVRTVFFNVINAGLNEMNPTYS